MAINFKPINAVPVTEELADGDMLLVNSGGTAKQIAASKVGGGGGGTMIYIKDFSIGDEQATGIPCKDAELTQVMSTAELLAAFDAGPVAVKVAIEGVGAWSTPFVTMQMGAVMSYLMLGESIAVLVYLCSDTEL